jgi:hypothetical protein
MTAGVRIIAATNAHILFSATMIVSLVFCTSANAQSPGVLYTWNGTGNLQDWAKNFGTNTVTLSNSIAGELTIAETGTPGEDVAIRDGANRTRESTTDSSGGLDLTGLDFL